MSAEELRPGQTPDVGTGWADATSRPYWAVTVPWLGDVYSYDRDDLARWLHEAAAQVEACQAAEHATPDAEAPS
jgi:hypothetical protein